MTRKRKWMVVCGAILLLGILCWIWWGNTALEINEYVVGSTRVPQSFSGFRIAQISDLMTHRGAAFHTLPTDGQGNAMPLMRVTPKEDQKILVLSSDLHQIGARVLSDTFNSSMVTDKVPYTESVAFWQGLQTPDRVVAAPAYMAANGAITQANSITVDNVFGVIYDRWALGVNLHDQRVAVTPLNANGLYVNYWYHEARRAYMDITENGVLFLAD